MDLPILPLKNHSHLPLIRQMETDECGLACLAMVLQYYGCHVDLDALRASCNTFRKVVTLESLVRLAARLHLSARPLRFELDEIGQLQCPAILHWDMKHFVVMKRLHRGRIIIHDPALGVRRMTLREASPHITGIAVEFSPMPDFERRQVRHRLPVSTFWQPVSKLLPHLFHALFLSGLLQAFALAGPMYTQLLIDEALTKMDSSLIGVLATGFGLLLLIQTTVSVIRRHVALYFGTRLSIQLTDGLHHHLLRLPMPWFERRHIGDILSRFESLAPVQRAVTEGLIQIILNAISLLSAGSLMLIYSVGLSGLALTTLLLYLVLRLASFSTARRLAEDRMICTAQERSLFMEGIRAIQTLKTFAKENAHETRWRARYMQAVNAGLREQHFSIWMGVANAFLFGIENILILYFGAHLVLDGTFTIGMLMAFGAYASQFKKAASTLVDGFVNWRLLSLHLERLADIALTEREGKRVTWKTSSRCSDLESDRRSCHLSIPTPPVTRRLEGTLEVRDLAFRYGEEEHWVLRNLNLRISSQQFFAISGASGVGKTTLLKLLMGLLDPDEGEILFDGIPLPRWPVDELRDQIGAVMQNDTLFSGTLAENIAFFTLSPDMAEIETAARAALIHDEIMSMPMGYHTLVGDMGHALSIGQQQRLLLARALYRKPRILFLDESTAHLDRTTSQALYLMLKKLPITKVVASHRTSLLQTADKQLLLQRPQRQVK